VVRCGLDASDSVGTSGGQLWTCWWTFGFCKRWGIFWLAEWLLASQKGFRGVMWFVIGTCNFTKGCSNFPSIFSCMYRLFQTKMFPFQCICIYWSKWNTAFSGVVWNTVAIETNNFLNRYVARLCAQVDVHSRATCVNHTQTLVITFRGIIRR